MILEHVDDKKTFIACTLSGHPLLSKARQALHADVCIIRERTWPRKSVNRQESIESTLKRFQSTDLAQYARKIRICSNARFRSDDERLLDILAMLATWKHEKVALDAAFFRELRPSLVHTLVFSSTTIRMNKLLCAIFAFPRLLHLEVCYSWFHPRGSGNNESRSLPCQGARPPQLHRLVLCTSDSSSPILEALYPINEQVGLNFLALGGLVGYDLAQSVVKRAQQLEEFCVMDSVPMPSFIVCTSSLQFYTLTIPVSVKTDIVRSAR